MTKKDNQVHCICMNHNKWGLDNAFAYMNRLLHSWYLFLSGKIVLVKQASQDRVEFVLIHAVDHTDGSLEQRRLTWPETHQDLLGLSWDLWPLRMTFLWSHKDDPPQRSFLSALSLLILLSPRIILHHTLWKEKHLRQRGSLLVVRLSLLRDIALQSHMWKG